MTQTIILEGSDFEDTYRYYSTRPDLINDWMSAGFGDYSDGLVDHLRATSTSEVSWQWLNKNARYDLSDNDQFRAMIREYVKDDQSADFQLQTLVNFLPSIDGEGAEYAAFLRGLDADPEVVEFQIY